MKKIEIEIPDGYELMKTDDGWRLEKESKNITIKRSESDDNLILCAGEMPTGEKIPYLVYIGNKLAPHGLRNQCIILNDSVEWEFVIEHGNHILIPKRK